MESSKWSLSRLFCDRFLFIFSVEPWDVFLSWWGLERFFDNLLVVSFDGGVAFMGEIPDSC